MSPGPDRPSAVRPDEDAAVPGTMSRVQTNAQDNQIYANQLKIAHQSWVAPIGSSASVPLITDSHLLSINVGRGQPRIGAVRASR